MSTPFKPIKTLDLNWVSGLPYVDNSAYYLPQKEQLHIEQVYLSRQQITQRWQALSENKEENFIIFDSHFKAGLTFLLSWKNWLQNAPESAALYYLCYEQQPLKKSDLSQILAQFPLLKDEAKQLIALYPILLPGFHYLSFAKGRVNLVFMLGDLAECLQELLICGEKNLEAKLRSWAIDAWLFKQAFSKVSNEDYFKLIALLSKTNTTLDYIESDKTINGNLKAVGFVAKRTLSLSHHNWMSICNSEGSHRQSATYDDLSLLSTTFNKAESFVYHQQAISLIKARKTPWHLPLPEPYKSKKVIVLGAGLAGCMIAHYLAEAGLEVILLDKAAELGSGASGNRQAILYPQLSAFNSPIAQFMLTAYIFAYQCYKQRLVNDNSIGNLSGILQLASNDQECSELTNLQLGLLAFYPELGKLISAQEASMYAGITVAHKALLLPLSGWLDSKELCNRLSNHSKISYIANYEVTDFCYDSGLWHCGDYVAETLVLAAGFETNQFKQTSFLPIKPVLGQVTLIKTQETLAALKMPLCGKGHILPASNGKHALGATYHPHKIKQEDEAADDLVNLTKLNFLLPDLTIAQAKHDNWSGIRATLADYFPLVGPIPDKIAFEAAFSPLASDRKRWLAEPSSCYPGLYAFTGFGSRGLTSIPLCASWLSAIITKQPTFFPQSFIRSCSPARFLVKAMIK